MRITAKMLREQIEDLNKYLEEHEKLNLQATAKTWGLFMDNGKYTVISLVSLKEVSYFLDGVSWSLMNK